MNQPLIDIIDECIDRLSAGESIDDCVADYPAYADDLREMLSIGALIGQLAPPTTEAEMAHHRTRQQLTSRIEQEENRPMLGRMKKKRKRRTVGVFTMGTAAVLALLAGIGIGIVTMNLTSTPRSTQADIPPDIAMTATAIINEVTAQANFTPVQLGPMPTPIEPTREVQVIRPVYRYADEWAAFANNRPGWFLLLRDNTLTGVFKVEVVNPGVPNQEEVRIVMPPEVMSQLSTAISTDGWDINDRDGNTYQLDDIHLTAQEPRVAMIGWTLSDDDGNIYEFDESYLTVEGLRILTRSGYDDMYNLIYMDQAGPIWEEGDILTLRDAFGSVIVQAAVSELLADENSESFQLMPTYAGNDQAPLSLTATQLVKEATIAANPGAIGTPVPLNPLDLTATAMFADGPQLDEYAITATAIVTDLTATAEANP